MGILQQIIGYGVLGLLGTVLDIMLTFYSIVDNGFDITRIMKRLALALKATALGTLVAIPAVTLYNLFLQGEQKYCPYCQVATEVYSVLSVICNRFNSGMKENGLNLPLDLIFV